MSHPQKPSEESEKAEGKSALQATYEKTALYRMGIPMEVAFARVSWLRDALEGKKRRRQPKPTSKRGTRQKTPSEST